MIDEAQLLEILRDRFEYRDGVFTYRKQVGNRRAGQVAGCLHRVLGRYYVHVTNPAWGRKLFLRSRLVWLWHTGALPCSELDHINGNQADDRIENLRDAGQAENMKNLTLYKKNKTGLHGVWWRDESQKYQVRIGVHGKLICLGHFDNLLDAACARKSAETRYGFHENHGRSGPVA